MTQHKGQMSIYSTGKCDQLMGDFVRKVEQLVHIVNVPTVMAVQAAEDVDDDRPIEQVRPSIGWYIL